MTILKAFGAVSFILFAIFLVLSILSFRDANYALIDAGTSQNRLDQLVYVERATTADHQWTIAISLFFVSLASLGTFGLAQHFRGKSIKCPQCAEEIKVDALKCRFCGHDFPAPITEPVFQSKLSSGLIKCPSCSRTNSAARPACVNCGAALTASAA